LLTNRNDYSHGVFHLTRQKLKNKQMKDQNNTKEELITELQNLRHKIDSWHAAAKVRTAELKSSFKKVLKT
jgi:SMC interacting uncharacterized protein involved in chromosome segregation